MILVVGGRGSGKREYARSLGCAESEMQADLHLLLRERTDVTEEFLETLLRKKVVLCNEVGSGIVPMEAEERAYRDRVGRVCARLAARAERVVRMCCGIPVCIKERAGEGEE